MRPSMIKLVDMSFLQGARHLVYTRTETLVSNDTTMNPRITTDVIVILFIFLVLVISLSVLAWRHPTSLQSLRALPSHGAALPASNIPTSVATYHDGRGFPYLMYLRNTYCAIYHWWIHTSRNRVPSIMIPHHGHTVARAPPACIPPVCITQLSIRISITTVAVTSLSTTNSESTELHDLDLDKAWSTSSVPETNDVDITSVHHTVTAGEPAVHASVGLVSEVHGPPLSTDPTVEINTTTVG